MSWSAAGLVAAWESAAGLSPPARTAALLATLGPADSLRAALEYDVGSAAVLLASGHTRAFGPDAEVVVDCPSCGASLEATVALVNRETAGPQAGASSRQSGAGGTETGAGMSPPASPRRVGGYRVRLPTLGELAAVHGSPGAADLLRQWCVRPDPPDSASPPDSPSPPDARPLPPALEAALEALAAAVLLHGPVTCPECRCAFEASLDVADLVWERVALEAPRLLAETAVLARAFGWSEGEILALSPARREAYLGLAGARP